MERLRRFWRQPSLHYRNFQLVFAPLAFVPLLSAAALLVIPEQFAAGLSYLDRSIGGIGLGRLLTRLPFVRMLAAGYMASVGFIGFWMTRNLRERRGLLGPFVFGLLSAMPVALTGWARFPESMLLLVFGLVAPVGALAAAITATLAANDIFGVRDARLVPRPTPSSGLGWTRFEHRWVETILDAALPPHPEDEIPGIEAVDLEEFWPEYVREVPLHFRFGLRAATWVVTFWPILTFRSIHTFHGLDEEARDDILLGLAKSESFILRQIIFVFKTTASFAYFHDSKVQRHFASAYDG